jgi:putative FmdB family regulatory protein
MPTYDYMCENCGHKFEQSQSIIAAPLRKCPVCKKMGLKRLLGCGSGIIFKGSGFYQTDYRSESYKKAAESEKKPAASPAQTKSKPKEPKPAKDKSTPGGESLQSKNV